MDFGGGKERIYFSFYLIFVAVCLNFVEIEKIKLSCAVQDADTYQFYLVLQ